MLCCCVFTCSAYPCVPCVCIRPCPCVVGGTCLSLPSRAVCSRVTGGTLTHTAVKSSVYCYRGACLATCLYKSEWSVVGCVQQLNIYSVMSGCCVRVCESVGGGVRFLCVSWWRFCVYERVWFILEHVKIYLFRLAGVLFVILG